MKEYIALANVCMDDGAVKELEAPRTPKIYDAYKALKVWKEDYGEMIRDRRIIVYGPARRERTIHITSGKNPPG